MTGDRGSRERKTPFCVSACDEAGLLPRLTVRFAGMSPVDVTDTDQNDDERWKMPGQQYQISEKLLLTFL